MKPTCSIVIRAYNEEKHIERLLTGIRQQSIQTVQTILVDSGSTDGTLRIAGQYNIETVQLQPKEFSFGRSLNTGIELATADIVVIASAHVYPVYPDWLEKLLTPFCENSIALTYGKQRGTVTSQYSENQIFRNWYSDNSISKQPHPFCNNANAAIRRSLWEIHPYDENLPALEDLEWAQWAQQNGYAISYSAEAEIIHVHNETWTGIFNRYCREGMAFKQLYPHEHFRLVDLFGSWIKNVLSDLRAAKREGALRHHSSDILRFRWAQFYGTYIGYRKSGVLSWKLKKTFYYPNDAYDVEGKLPRQVDPIRYHEKEG